MNTNMGMPPIEGYSSAKLLRSSRLTRTYEATREDGLEVVAKIFELDHDDIEARIEHEIETIRALDIDGVVPAIGVERVGGQLVVLYERVPGVPLSEFRAHGVLDLDTFLPLARRLAEILARIHDHHLIHGDVKPTSVVVSHDGDRLYFAEFGTSSLAGRERDLDDPRTLALTLPYLSPEQTGRTGDPIDARSDLYSLGAVFYELLTGLPPFVGVGDDALGLIHAHVAEPPQRPRVRRPELPEALSRIVMKLLEKAPERRYQRAAGLLHDLERLGRNLQAGEHDAVFELGLEDSPGELRCPRRLYGRERELALLLAELEHATRQLKPRMILIGGPPGIGKSAVAASLAPEARRRRGLVGRGGFDVDRQRFPYSGWIEALDGVLEQLLASPAAALEDWRERLERHLGRLAWVLVDLLPALERALGELPPEAAPVGARETQNRLQLAFARLLAALSEAGPLILILDDLHAADDSSVDLLTTLLDGGDCGTVMLLGTYRSEQLEAHAKLSALAERVRLDTHSGSTPQRLRGRRIELAPLGDQATAQILRDLLGDDDDELAAQLSQRTGNNPQFVLALAEHLRRVGLLEQREGRWTWDPAALAAASTPGDFVATMRARLDELEALDADAAEILRRAACVGRRFDLRALELACERERGELLRLLARAAEAGLLVREGRTHRFAHPSIRALALADLAAEVRRSVRWRLGQAMLAQAEAGERELASAVLYAIVDHLDAGLDAGKLSDEDRRRLVRLNLDAGKRALATASHAPALRYLELAVALVTAEAREVRERGVDSPAAALVFELYFARAEALSLIGERGSAGAAFDELLEWRLDMAEYSRVVAGRIRLLALQDRNEEAVALAQVGLRRCGVTLGEQPSKLALLLALARAWLSLRGRSREDLLGLAPAEDPRACAAMTIIAATGPAAYARNPQFFLRLSTTHLGLVMRHGAHPSAPQAIAHVAMAFAFALRKSEAAASFVDTALAMTEGPDHPDYGRVEVVAIMIWHLSRPLAATVERLEAAYERNLDLGDFEFVSYLASLSMSINLEVGTHLRTLIETCHRLERDLGNWAAPTMRTMVRVTGALAAALANDLDAGLGEVSLDEQGTPTVLPFSPASLVDPTPMELHSTTMSRAVYLVIMGQHAAALALFDEIDDYERVMMGSWSIPRAAMAHGVAAAARRMVLGNTDPSERRRLRKIVERKLGVCRRWARTCPENYLHFQELLEAELAMMRGRLHEGVELFERAREHAKRQLAAYVAALACERMSAHLEAQGLTTLARGPLREAWAIYQRWGARAKLRQLEQAHRRTEVEALERSSAEHRAAPSGHGLGNLAIDLETVTRALASISEELDPELLVCKILETAMTIAGADHGALLVETEDDLALAALGSEGRRVHALSPPLDLDVAAEMLPMSVINLVARSGKPVVVDDARADARFARDPYVERTGLRSLLCVPLGKRQRKLGVLVLENRRSAARFGEERLSVLGFVATQAGGALDNANLYRALHRSEVQWRSLVDSAPDLIALLDAQGELTFVNRSLPGWVVGRPPMPDPNSREGWTGAIDGALDHARRSALEIALIHSEDDDQLHWYEAHIAPVEIEHEARQVMVIATEITERKLADARRRELEAQLRQQQRLESLGTLASGVAHEINNPIQGILNYAELLEASKTEPELVSEFSGEISTEAQRVSTIVRSLLAFSRRETTTAVRESTTIAQVLDGTLSLIHSTLRKHQIEVHLQIPEDLPYVSCHSQQIQQIVMNLVTNARDALNQRYPDEHPDKVIEIVASAPVREGRQMVRISVIDHGTGIPESVRAHIFDPFFTTKGRDQGTGLGLSVSHGIAQDHGGEMWVESELGVGTRFHLELPALETDA